MRIVPLLSGFFLLVSCDLFTSKEMKTQSLLDHEIANIDFNDVDQFPLFENCDEADSKAENKSCFEETLLPHFSNSLAGFEFVLKEAIVDTLYLDFLVDKNGVISILDTENNAILKNQIPDFDSLILKSLSSLPRVIPALKRGVPVKAKFRIPIILNTK